MGRFYKYLNEKGKDLIKFEVCSRHLSSCSKSKAKKEPLLHFLFSTGCCCLGNTRCLIKVFSWCLFSMFALAKTLSYGHKGRDK